MFLLDTGVLLGFVIENRGALRAQERFALGTPETTALTSVVCKGELLALAEKRRWGKTMRNKLSSVLDRVPVEDINSTEVLHSYALISAWTEGKKVKAPGNAPPPKPARPMKQNDMWVAATAHAAGATLLSADKDFEHLDKIWFPYVYIDLKDADSN